MAELGTQPSVIGVAQLYAPWVGTLVIDEADRRSARAVEAQGVRCVVAPTIMDSPKRAAALAQVVLGTRD
jgi:LPPG:FO 2-phospho-L-lactate transferase